jgi:cell division protein FtsI (penicillin-binding protein 3)
VITRWIRLRIFICAAILALAGIKVARRAFHLQLVQSEELRARAEDQSMREIELLPQRGRILDRRGNELAGSALFDSVACNPRVLLKVPEGPERLAAALSMDKKQLRRSLEAVRTRPFAWVRRTVSPDDGGRVRALNLPGVHMRREPKRVYPRNEIAATVIGHANVDGKGVEGVERAFDAVLRGTPTRLVGIKDGSGREMLMEGLVDRKDTIGKDVVLSLDQFLSHVTHEALARAVKKWNAKAGTAVVMDPRSGEVLAMASVPSYNPEQPGEGIKRGATRNRAITDILEPGSTMKTFTMAAAFEDRKVRPHDLIDCQSGRPLMIGKSRIRDSHPEGVLTAEQVFQRSSNIGTVKIARALGKQSLHETLIRFGFGRRTGVGLGGELPGLLRPVGKWGDIHFANIAFGQGMAVTPLQLVAGYAAIANGGIYNPPRLALKIVGTDGKEQPVPLPAAAGEKRRVLSAETAQLMLSIMRGVTGDEGTARQAAMDGYAVGGKTGTAQKVRNGRYDDEAWIGSFVGIVPADDPRLVIAVIIDEPHPEHRGGMVAAPAFREIAESAVRYLGLPPNQAYALRKPVAGGEILEEGTFGLAGADGEKRVGAPAVADAIEGSASEQPLWAGPEALDDVMPVLGEDESENEAASPSDTRIIAGVESLEGDGAGADQGDTLGEGNDNNNGEGPEQTVVTVPSFAGMSIGEAIRAAADAGVELALEGSGIAVAQMPPPGPLRRGSLCRVSFRPGS